jgi:hypothetical protein
MVSAVWYISAIPPPTQRISEEESYKRAINRQLAVTCVQVQDKSICWLFR